MNITSRTIETARLNTSVLERAAQGKANRNVLLVHGNVSSGEFFRDLMNSLPADVHVVAPDLRGYGQSEAKPVDATRGVRDWADDLRALMDALNWKSAHLLGWSMGGGVIMQAAIDAPERVDSLTLVSPVSPFGFGGVQGVDGKPNTDDYAGSGGGTVNADFVKAVKRGDRSDAPGSPLDVMRKFYFNAENFQPTPEQEQAWLTSMLQTKVGDDFYPGDLTPSPHWPMVAPGTKGVANAFSSKYMNVSGFADIGPQPPVLWVRGDSDAVVGDTSLFDLAQLGALGVVPGWPGADSVPPQPMIREMRAVLEKYQAIGGTYREVVLEGVGHSPFIEAPEQFKQAFLPHISG